MLKAHETAYEEYNTTSAWVPASSPHALSRHQIWLEACEKLGYSPQEWKTYGLPVPDWDRYRRLIEEREAEQAAIRAEYEASTAHMLAVVRFAPEQFRKALGGCDCGGDDA